MAFPDTQNRPASHIVAPADPNVEGADSGMNAGSCYPYIGLATAIVNPDQDLTPPYTPLAQPIGFGGDSVVSGQETADLVEYKVADYEGADFNDTAIFEACDIGSVGAQTKGDVINITSGAILKSDLPAPMTLNDEIWGAVPVA